MTVVDQILGGADVQSALLESDDYFQSKVPVPGRPRLWWFEESGSVHLFRGPLGDTLHSRDVALIHYIVGRKRPDTVELHYLKVQPHQQGKGYAKLILAKFLDTLRTRHPEVRFISGSPTSGRVLRIVNAAFGKPVGLYLKGRRVTPDDAIKYLPADSPESTKGHGIVDLSTDPYIRMKHRVPPPDAGI